MEKHHLQLGIIGNGQISALIDREGTIVWSCWPRFDADPICSSLVNTGAEEGFWQIEIQNMASKSQQYRRNTAMLETTLTDTEGNALTILDYCPRYEHYGREYSPTTLVRRVRIKNGRPRMRMKFRPHFGYGEHKAQITRGSNHVRYLGGEGILRMTTNLPQSTLLEEGWYTLHQDVYCVLSADEPLQMDLFDYVSMTKQRTEAHWCTWVGSLALPLDWQEEIIRSAITLRLCTYDDTGAIVAAMTTSLPEAEGEERNWDYRYCWLRDALFVVRILNRLGYTNLMVRYQRYLLDRIAESEDGHLQPLYSISGNPDLPEYNAQNLKGYEGHTPVRVGNQAAEHLQYDAYGSVVLAMSQAFFDHRVESAPSIEDFQQLERVGEKAYERYAEPDAGIWEFRGIARVHTHSAVMCWAACDRLRSIAQELGLQDREAYWENCAQEIRSVIEKEAWNEELQTYAAAFGGETVDASLLLLHEVGYCEGDDPRFRGTVERIQKELQNGPFVYRYKDTDDFGNPQNAFLICSFWLVDALIAVGKEAEAQEIFCELLEYRNHLGLFAEHVDPKTGELWGNFPQTYSHVGLITAALRLSRKWEMVV